MAVLLPLRGSRHHPAATLARLLLAFSFTMLIASWIAPPAADARKKRPLTTKRFVEPFVSMALAVSADGNVIVGKRLERTTVRAVYWRDGFVHEVGDLPGGDDYASAHGVSADGSVIVGESHSERGMEAFRFTEEGGIEPLGDLEGGAFASRAYAVSGDGKVIVGSSRTDRGLLAFRYADGVMTSLGALPRKRPHSVAKAVNHDGSVIVGFSTSKNGDEAFVYRDGVMTGLGVPSGMQGTRAFGVSADGRVIVGTGTIQGGRHRAFRHVDGRYQWLGDLPGGAAMSGADAVSADGEVVVGKSNSGNGAEAYAHQDGTMRGLGDLAGSGFRSRAFGVSGDGRVIVGRSTGGKNQLEAVRFDASGVTPLSMEAPPSPKDPGS